MQQASTSFEKPRSPALRTVPSPGSEDDLQTLRINDANDVPATKEEPGTPQSTPQPAEHPKKPYSIFTSREKWTIVIMAAVAGLFSPLTSQIYFPALPTLVQAFHTSTENINLTVTIYMVLQGSAPMFWGTLADRWGRRPMFMACMLVLSLSCVGLALVPTNAFWLLMVLRCVQAAGSASTIALGAGVIADISERHERGNYFGVWSLGPMVGPSLGPVIGGGLAQGLGWRSIFWFLCIGSTLCLLVMLLILPETLRAIVGDGSIVPPAIYRPLLPIIGRNRLGKTDEAVERPPKAKFQNPFRILFYWDVLILLLFNGVQNSLFYAMGASTSTLFAAAYPHLSETSIGLCFLALGGGMLAGSWVNGKVLDAEYRRVRRTLERAAAADPERAGMRPEDAVREEDFPIEYARCRLQPIYLVVYVACAVGYGWALQAKVNIAVPLVLQIIFGYAVICVMNTTQTLSVDLVPSQSSSISACNNFVRCSLGAVTVSVLDLMIEAMGVGWTFVLLSGLCVATAPLLLVIMFIGPKFRRERRDREARRKAEKAAEKAAREAAQEHAERA
ncbi:MFS general substrate transporter [Phanerochaete sordida]|uniref:MFS general substrate transporter n=1 Tax=Phanerochaete sordida TaxID=48140 RepID=A0A9P3GQ20_9APHY|nr:MFS general substrate transporter [Phanerochaete sordida]